MLWKLARRLVKEEGADYLLRARDGTYEEIMLQGMVICLLKEPPQKTFERLSVYMAKIDNWTECETKNEWERMIETQGCQEG